jgi:chemosensory pili system protein ChpA (sensor histidine kinase/response regulator)
MSEVASQTLEFVGRELNTALGDARSALESYVEQPDNLALLERCATELHQVQGVLRVLEIYGAALLAEEMEQVARYLLATAGERKSQAESLDALMRAMVQLPSYLERVLAGGRDLALVLLPLLNDLRAVRGSALLSEGTLLLLNLKSDRQAQPLPAAPGEAPLSVEQWARRLRARFQVGLVGWIRGERLEQNLDILAAVSQKLEQVATRQPVFQLWWVVGAVIEALQEGGLEGGVSVKRLLGLADREIKRLFDQGEARYSQTPPVELLNNLLYYVGRAESAGPRVTAVRASFRLAELLPVDESIEQERENLSAPSVKLMQTVAAAIREDLGKVKDVLDIFVRRGAGQPAELAPQSELLRKIGDTLGVLGLGELRANVQKETERLDKIVAGKIKADESVLVEIAATLISVEDRLDDRLVGMILPRQTQGTSPQETDTDFQQVQSAVLRECILNLARIKESIAQNVGGTLDAAGLDAWPELFRGLKAGLLMLGKTRAVDVVETITRHLKPVMQPGGGTLPGGGLDRLADAIVSLEYYMETLQAGRSDPWYMLDNAQVCLQALDDMPVPAVPNVAPLEPTAFAQTVQLAPLPPTRLPEADEVPTDVGIQPPASVMSKQPSMVLAEHADPELVNLFVEEAREELEKITRHFPAWEQNPLEHSALVTVRRSFHTLKGSGRMVGARDLSEFAWSIENLLNRLLDNTLARSPQIVACLRDGVNVLPELVEQLETGRTPRTNTAAISSRAHALAANKTPAPSLDEPAEPPTRPNVAAAPSPAPAPVEQKESAPAAQSAASKAVTAEKLGSDDVLREIYTREASSHVATVRGYLEREARRTEPHLLPEEIYRACHTLSGSSKMAEARHGIRLAQPLDHWLRKAFDSGLGLRNEDLALLGDCMSAMEAVVSHLDESTGYFVTHEELLERISVAEADLDRQIAENAAVAEHSGLHESSKVLSSGAPERDLKPATPPPSTTQSRAPVAPPRARPIETPPPAASFEEDAMADFDPEVAGIFTEEATELIEASESALMAWRTKPNDPEYLAALKRPLHTLKGGARMAGIIAMGDLSHELETLVNLVDSGIAPAEADTFDVLQTGLDELARMRDSVAAGRAVTPARALIDRIRILEGAQPLDAEGPRLDALAAPVKPSAPGARTPTPPPPPQKPAVLVPEIAPPKTVESSSVFGTRGRSNDGAIHFEPTPPTRQEPPREPLRADSSHGETQRIEPPRSPVLSDSPRFEFTPSGAWRVDAPRADVGRGADRTTDRTTDRETPSAAPTPPSPPPLRPIETPTSLLRGLDGGSTPPASRSNDSVKPSVPSPSRSTDATGSFAIRPASSTSSGASLSPPPIVRVTASIKGADGEELQPPAPVPPGREPVGQTDRAEMARVDADLLDQLLNCAGEVSISRARLEQQVGSIDFNLGELSRTVTRLKEQLRKLEIETETQILHRHEEEGGGHRSEFDPLELDRYSTIQQFSRALAETASDVASIQGLLETLAQDTQNLLQQQARTVTELQNGLMRTRMVPFQRHVQRLARIVRQAAADTGKRADLVVEGASGELDRQVLERMLPPFEHMLRNAVVHGIEKPEERIAKGKPEIGRIRLELHREGAEVMVKVSDDGAGMNLKAIRDKGAALGLIQPGQTLSDEDAMQLILEPGFSTAGSITQQAGRGVGMDVVATEIKRLGGALHMESNAGEGTKFTIRLPFTLAISHALVVRTGDEFYALPLPTVEGVLRLSKAEVSAHLGRDAATFDHSGTKYRFQHLATFVGLEVLPLPDGDVTIPVVLVRAGEHSTGLIADELVGSREIVVKSVGPQVSSIRGISGATILGDGRIVIILDIGALVRAEWRGKAQQPASREKGDRRTFAMVVDDSITVRRVTQRLLERNGMRVLTARDGMDAVSLLQDNVPDIILLDIEMPRMDGYEVAAHVRNDPRLKDVPIIMITSRVGEKHRARAIELGVDDYLGKPYQEAQLLDAIAPLVERHRETQRSRRFADAGQ